MVETLAELPLIGDQVVCLNHDQARSLDRENARRPQSNRRWVNWRFASSRGVAEFARKGQPRWLSHGTHVSSV